MERSLRNVSKSSKGPDMIQWVKPPTLHMADPWFNPQHRTCSVKHQPEVCLKLRVNLQCHWVCPNGLPASKKGTYCTQLEQAAGQRFLGSEGASKEVWGRGRAAETEL